MKEKIVCSFFAILLVACSQQVNSVTPILSPRRISVPTLPVETLTAMETQATHWKFCGGNPEPDQALSERQFSPDGLWLAVSCQGRSEIDNYSFVLRLDGSQVYKIPLVETYLQHQNGTLSPPEFFLGSIYPHHWANDSKILFLSAEISHQWGSPIAVVGLYKLDVVTRNITPLLPILPVTEYSGYELQFSPDDEFLAYVLPDAQNEIHLLSLNNSQEQKIQVDNKYLHLLDIQWSPNSDKLVFCLTTSDISGDGFRTSDGQNTLFLYEVNSGTVTTLLPDSQLYPIEWLSNTELLLETFENKEIVQYKFDMNASQVSLFARYVFDPNTFERILVTPTP